MKGNIIGGSITLFLVIVFTILSLNIHYIIASFVIGSFATSLLLIIWTKEKIIPWCFERVLVKSLFKESLPLGIMLVFNLVYFRLDIYILSVLKPTVDVGIYGLSYKFFDFLIALPLFLSNSIYPHLLRNLKNYRIFLSIKKNYLWVYLVSSIALIIPFWFISPLFTFIKSDFYQSIVPFRILLLSLPFFFMTSFLQWVLISKKEQKFLMYVYLFSAILNFILNIIFIPVASYVAAAIITGVSEAFVFFFLFYKTISIEKNIQKQHSI